MSKYLLYIFEVSCVFTALYIVYYLVFRCLTFHSVNRVLLLISLPLSLIIPLLDFGLYSPTFSALEIPKFEEILPVGSSVLTQEASSNSLFNFSSALLILYCGGLLIYIVKMGLSVNKLYKTKQKSKVSCINGYYIVSAKVPSVFSCFNWIFVPGHYADKLNDPVIEHEKIHASLGHTIDLFLTELFIALLWFHPFVFFFRKSIKSVHEYQVDSRILLSNIKKSHYLKLMLENLESRHRMIGLYSYFSGLTIKNRVKMITKNKSHKIQLIRYLVLLPVITLLAMSFTKSGGEQPKLFPISEGDYTKITVEHGKKFVNPFTNKETTHKGIDIAAQEGVMIMAASGGTIIKVSFEKGWGNLVVIDHGDGYETWYAHLKDFSVEQGQQVKKGQVIGHVGNTGYSTGPHLHFEVRLDNKAVDPMDYVEK